MIKPLKTTTQFYASTRKEAEEDMKKIHKDTTGTINRVTYDEKIHKEFGVYCVVTYVEEFAAVKDVVEGGIY